MIDRRKFLQASVAATLASGLPVGWAIRPAGAMPAAAGLANPTDQFDVAGFVNDVPDAMAPSFKYQLNRQGRFQAQLRVGLQKTGLVDATGTALETPVWGYADLVTRDKVGYWPGKTFEVKSKSGTTTEVQWANALKRVPAHLLPVDTSMHWCYSLPGYEGYTIPNDGVPIITHLHGGHSDFQYDGNPEFFYSPAGAIQGPQWANVYKGFTEKFQYDNGVQAGTLWYHDHALGITRLNVYAGLAGFYIVRDDLDTGLPRNDLNLPAWPYEKAYAIQDRMFLSTGELFYPAFPNEPFYEGFITDEGAVLPPDIFPGGGPTGLAEFFGDHMVVNGKIWPREKVEPRNYRMRLLNGTDSRFMALEFWAVGPTDKAVDPENMLHEQLEFSVIGSDQGFGGSPASMTQLLSEPGSRYDVIVDFSRFKDRRVIMRNVGGDEPFGGDIPGPQVFECTDRVMAFDVVYDTDFDQNIRDGLAETRPDVTPLNGFNYSRPNYDPVPSYDPYARVRKVALFEGRDEFGRLQPLLGTAEPATDYSGAPINWPNTPKYAQAMLPNYDENGSPDGTGTPSALQDQIEGSVGWHSPTTENPALDSDEEWEIWNMTGDGHPIHLHLVNFEVINRQEIVFDSNADEDGFMPDGVTPADDGVYLVPQPTVQHNSVAGDPSTYGTGFKIVHPSIPAKAYGDMVAKPASVFEASPKDMVTALPGQVTRIRARFDKPGRYVWHCHILSHEDHEMMRVLHVGHGA